MDFFSEIGPWANLISGFCGLLLGVVVIALISSPSFRQDLAAHEGRANLLGKVSVEGTFILALCVLFFVGMMYPIVFPSGSFKKMAEVNGFSSKTPTELIDEALDLRREVEENEKLIKEINTSMQATAAQTKNMILKENIPAFIEELSPDHWISDEIFNFPAEKRGPWGELPASKKVFVSVPQTPPNKGSARVCPGFENRRYDLISDFHIDDAFILGERVTVNADDLLFMSSDACEDIDYVMQLSCYDAKRIFTSKVLDCSSDGKAKWNIKNPKSLPVKMVESGRQKSKQPL
ncbi:hypothetical protein QQM79_19615 [Marinobacteraceae bacterium S3BR75-40.1]